MTRVLISSSQTSKDYLGMALRDNILYFVYKLNGNVNELKSWDITTSKSDPAYFDRVDLRRFEPRTSYTKIIIIIVKIIIIIIL